MSLWVDDLESRLIKAVAKCKRIVAEQHERIALLRHFGRSLDRPEHRLSVFIGTLNSLEDYERSVRRELPLCAVNLPSTGS